MSTTDYDSPWKAILERYLADFLALCFPQVHAGIDWARGYTFLDNELQQVTPDAALGRRRADKLVQVWRNDGAEAWVLIHIEVQSQEETGFAQRMFVYYYRLLDRYDRQVASLAVLGDDRAGWRPQQFTTALWGCDLQFRFPTVKLLDYQTRRAELEQSRNPFATVVMAHLETLATRGDSVRRSRSKLALMRRLYDLGYTRDDIISLFRFIDWLMALPEVLAGEFWRELAQFEEERKMTYVTSVERIGIEKGLAQGLVQGREEGREEGRREGLVAAIRLGLDLRFGEAGLALLPEIEQITDLTVLEAIYGQLKTVESVDAVRTLYM